MSFITLENCRIDSISSLYNFHTILDVLRLDLIHPVISGNKWFKLKEYIREATQLNKSTIITFGGAYSNHILAAAATAKEAGLKSIGLIRGEKPAGLSPTLTDAQNYGMQLFFISREDYSLKKIPLELRNSDSIKNGYLINEGGYGILGAKGAGSMLNSLIIPHYTHIVVAVGTGTTLAGLVNACLPDQKVLGISVMKNNYSLLNDIKKLVNDPHKNYFDLDHTYHFGGYAKKTGQLIDFMNKWFKQTSIPTDFIYTGKLFFAVNDLINKKYFPPDSKILVVHSGGLQGNRSLSKGTLIFS